MTRCPQCGHANNDTSKFCAHCGAELHTPESLQIGQTMDGGRYRVVKQLGKGGMGAIYLAQNRQAFDRQCVIKELIAYYEPGEEAKAQARFEEEARTLAALKHPGIPDMYGYFSEGGSNYIVMEYIEGDDLRHVFEGLVQGATLEEAEIVRYGVEICRVLEYLSRVTPEPVVHCDLKPANIIIDRNSHQAVLVDFGTARARYSKTALRPDGKRPSVYGTVGYAAPELFSGLVVPKSDVFALAATLYALLTGDDPQEHPFKWPAMPKIVPGLRSALEEALADGVAARSDARRFRQQLEAYRASLTGGIQPLTFPGGDQVTSLTGVLDLSIQHWDYARGILYDGSLDNWLRNSLHDPVAADRAMEAAREFADLPDAGLDAFMRGLSSRLAAPKIELTPAQGDLGEIRAGESKRYRIRLTNHGPGGAHGEISTQAPWLQVTPRTFGLAPGASLDVSLRISDVGLLTRGAAAVATVKAEAGSVLTEAQVRILASGRATGSRPSRPATSAANPATTRPAQPAPPRKQGAVRRGLPWALLGGAAGIMVVMAIWLGPMLTQGPASLDKGIAAMRSGDWEAAQKALGNVDPSDRQAVAQVAEELDRQTVALASGVLHMGLADGSLDQRPVHDVTIGSIEVDRYEVTNVQYQRYVDQAGARPPDGWAGGRFARGDALQPVTGVSWDDAQGFAAYLGKRLPSEAEWEWAARGAEGRVYPWGDADSSGRANTAQADTGGVVEVGSYPSGSTPDGIADLAGNVREWTADRYGPYSDPHAPPTTGEEIVVRGGSWRTYNDVSGARERALASERADDLGFRCVRGS